MKFKEQPLQTFRLQNFKAVRNSGAIKFTPLTVFIGNNGSGKSSIVEGLETFQTIVTEGLDEAMAPWRGFENVLNKAVRRSYQYPKEGRPYLTHPLSFLVTGSNIRAPKSGGIPFRMEMDVTTDPGANEVFVRNERFVLSGDNGSVTTRFSDDKAMVFLTKHNLEAFLELSSAKDSVLTAYKHNFFSDWQFLALDPKAMGEPRPQKRSGGRLLLERDGANLGDYLFDLLERDADALNGIIEALRYVLPYARDVQPSITSELQRTIYLQLSEGHFKIPGWLLSTGTLRVLAILAVLRHPNPPPLLCIEEIENGLDPRTINLVVDEIRQAITRKEKPVQVICTTHSPYLLDLLDLSHIIVVERDETGQPTFTRPDEKQLGEWAKKFAPGQLYTMNQLTKF